MEEESHKAQFWDYWACVAGRAWKDTTAWFPINKKPGQAVARFAVFAVASYFLYLIAGATPVIENWSTAVSFLAATLFVGASFYALNFIAAPYRIDRELRKENASLQQKKLDKSFRITAAKALRKYLDQADGVIAAQGDVVMRGDVKEIARRWDSRVVECMRSHNLPESEIHMFETIATIPKHTSFRIGQSEQQLRTALEAKRNRLRLIISGLLED